MRPRFIFDFLLNSVNITCFSILQIGLLKLDKAPEINILLIIYNLCINVILFET